MIRILGSEDGPEADAARALQSIIADSWPWIQDSEIDFIDIIPCVQCHGELPRDIDIVLLAWLPETPTFRSYLTLDTDTGYHPLDNVGVRSLCLALEVKEHDPTHVRFIGAKVEVAYGHGANLRWSSATQQSEGQKYSLKRFLERHTPHVPMIVNLLWLRNVSRDELPKPPHNIIPSQFTWNSLLNTVAQNLHPRRVDSTWVIDAYGLDPDHDIRLASKVLTKRLTPTALDRRRMDRICDFAAKDEWASELGQREVIFQGRGGTGKTMILLQLARRLAGLEGKRVLLLTYNKALVADLRRLMTMLGIPDDIGVGDIRVQTVHSFLYAVLSTLDLLEDDEDFLADYEVCKQRALDYFAAEVVTKRDIADLHKLDPNRFDWDFIFVDEGQDWPDNERDLLHAIYDSNRFVIADGLEQLVRTEHNCDWTGGLDKVQAKRFSLRKGLRMKRNLAHFVNSFVRESGLVSWSIEVNEEAVGGEVIVVEGDYFEHPDLHQYLMDNNARMGNSPVDMLACVPPSLVEYSVSGNVSMPATRFKDLGQEVWDGVAEDLRGSYPTSVEQLRIVQYDSCRGLEGWIVINFALDDFLEYKRALWPRRDHSEPGIFVDDRELPMLFAIRWMMIPMTRAIDTLVIQLEHNDSIVKQTLRSIMEADCHDFIQWYGPQ